MQIYIILNLKTLKVGILQKICSAIKLATGGGIDMIGKLEDIKINYFDIVICLEVFEHLPYPKEVIKYI